MTLSCVIIAKDEEELLPRSLDSLIPLYWDELIVMDSGSTDRTVEIARSYGARIEPFDWVNDFAAARNHAESLCSGDYVYMQDADDILVEGHDLMREVVSCGEDVGVRPLFIFSRDEFGAPAYSFPRNAALHKRGAYVWKGKTHEWMEGPAGRIDRNIVVEQIMRKGGDRPHPGDMVALHANILATPGERQFFYLAREHSYVGNHYEVMGLCDQLLALPVEWPIQRSHAAILKGHALKALGRTADARAAYLQAMDECDDWAEPYYYLGVLHYDLQQWAPAVDGFRGAVNKKPPVDYFSDDSIYLWRRYDLLAVVLSKLGRLDEAREYGAIALAARPEDKRLRENMRWYTGELS